MQQAEKTQRPLQRQQEVNQRRWVERHGVPLCEKRYTAIVVRIPEWQFSVPETFALKMGDGIREKSVIADDEGFQAGQNLWKRGQNQQREENSKSHGRKKSFSEVVAAGRLHTQIKTSGGAKCNCGWSPSFSLCWGMGTS